jgi:hypothetical protein
MVPKNEEAAMSSHPHHLHSTVTGAVMSAGLAALDGHRARCAARAAARDQDAAVEGVLQLGAALACVRRERDDLQRRFDPMTARALRAQGALLRLARK